MTRALVFGVLALLLAACGKQEPGPRLRHSDPPVLAGGWQTWDRPEFTLAAPDNWSPYRRRRLNNDPAPTGDGLSGRGLPPEMNQMMDGFEAAARKEDEAEIQKLAAEGIPLRLYDNSHRTLPAETPIQLTVKVTKESGLRFEDEAKGLFAELNVDKKSQAKVELPVGPAVEIVTETTNRIGDVVHQILYLLIDGERRYVFTFLATNNHSAIAGVARPIMETFRIKP